MTEAAVARNARRERVRLMACEDSGTRRRFRYAIGAVARAPIGAVIGAVAWV
jgi:hypothetical protein